MPHKSSEVSDMFDIEPRTLFVYESENLIAPERTPTQRRRYSRRDIERIRLIRELTTVHADQPGWRQGDLLLDGSRGPESPPDSGDGLPGACRRPTPVGLIAFRWVRL